MSLKQAVLTLAQQQPQLRKHLIPLLRGAATAKKASWSHALTTTVKDLLDTAYQAPAFPKHGIEIEAIELLEEVMRVVLENSAPGAGLQNERPEGSQSDSDSFEAPVEGYGGPEYATDETFTVTAEAPEALVLDLHVRVRLSDVAHGWANSLHRKGYTFQPTAIYDAFKATPTPWYEVWHKVASEVETTWGEDWAIPAHTHKDVNDNMSEYLETNLEPSDDGGSLDHMWSASATLYNYGQVTLVDAARRAEMFEAEFKVTVPVTLRVRTGSRPRRRA